MVRKVGKKKPIDYKMEGRKEYTNEEAFDVMAEGLYKWLEHLFKSGMAISIYEGELVALNGDKAKKLSDLLKFDAAGEAKFEEMVKAVEAMEGKPLA